MKPLLRNLAVAGAALAALAPAALADSVARDDAASLRRSTMGTVPARGASLLVTFADRPAGSEVAQRLSGLGRVSESVPGAGIWELKPYEPGSAREQAEARTNVVRVEWALVRRLAAFPTTRKPPIPALPEIAVADPTDSYYTDGIAGQWSLHTGRWRPSLTGRPERPIIALLDSGLDTTHPEWDGPGLVVAPWSTIRNIPSAPDWSTSGHGTHVAGIAAAPADGVGVVGVAPADPAKPAARVIPVQIATSDGVSTDATIMAGIVHAVNNGAKVINISSGGPGYSQAFQDTINWAFKKGAVIVASVGNEGLDYNPLNFPAGYDHVIGVGAQCDGVVNQPLCPTAYGRAAFSNSNFSVDVLAPGVNVVSTLATGVVDLTEPNGYGRMEGTSMAAPYVAGAAALIYASHPGIKPHQVIRLIEGSGNRAVAGWKRNDLVGWGVLHTANAVNATAPANDMVEPNDDVNWVPKNFNIALTASQPVKKFSAWADYFDDPMDVYAVPLSQGRLVRVTISSTKAKLRAYAFHGKGRISPRIMSDAAFERRFEGATSRATPTTRSFVFRARSTGRHYIQVLALDGGGDYSLRLERLN